MGKMGLDTYLRKRNFKRTVEPKGKISQKNRRRFVVHEHHASRLHFDFRLEIAGVLKSWAIPKGPSLDPRQRRLAVMVEDHPVDYIDFEGNISEGNYGAGEVVIWDSGKFELMGREDPLKSLEEGKLSFILHGEKLKGEFTLVRMERRDKQRAVIKKKDEVSRLKQEIMTRFRNDENGNDEGEKKRKHKKSEQR